MLPVQWYQCHDAPVPAGELHALASELQTPP
eukprot:SAG31_NODE_7288_length_1731_cov_1.142157_1_plen_30_part_10